MFGSAARQDGGIDSDIDIFVVRPAGVDSEDVTWNEQLHDLGDAVLTWTGNHAGIIDFAEQDIAQLQDENPPVLQDLRRDGIDLTGTSLRELLGSTQ